MSVQLSTAEKIAHCRETDDRQLRLIYICGNDETICDGYVDESTDAWRDEIGDEFVRAAAAVISAARPARNVDYEVRLNFRDWNGGRHYQFRKHGYLVVSHDADAPRWLRELIERAEHNARHAAAELIEKLERLPPRVG